MKIKIIKTCRDCECYDHTGTFGSKPKYICNNKNVRKAINQVNAKYWYDFPIIANMTVKAKLEIPDWCPLEDYKEEK